jgi:hypothetical protein
MITACAQPITDGADCRAMTALPQDLFKWNCGDGNWNRAGLCALMEADRTANAPYGNYDTQEQGGCECKQQYVSASACLLNHMLCGASLPNIESYFLSQHAYLKCPLPGVLYSFFGISCQNIPLPHPTQKRGASIARVCLGCHVRSVQLYVQLLDLPIMCQNADVNAAPKLRCQLCDKSLVFMLWRDSDVS